MTTKSDRKLIRGCFFPADPEELKNHVHCLGTYNVRSHRLIEISKAYISDPPRENDVRPSRPASPIKRCLTDTPRRNERYTPTPISHLPGTGPYALDSYRIFCLSHSNPFCEEWKAVLPTDKELVLYLVCLSYLSLSLLIQQSGGSGRISSGRNGHRSRAD